MEISGKTFAILLGLFAAITFGVILNPLLSTNMQRFVVVMISEFVVLGFWTCWEVWKARMVDLAGQTSGNTVPINQTSTESADHRSSRILINALFFALILGAWFTIYRERWNSPVVFNDDAKYLERAKDWQTTRDSLFVPFCEHIVVPTRLLTFAIADLWRSDAERAMAMAISVIPLFELSLLLLFLLVRREWNSDFIALLTVTLFALTRCYHEIITWYSATQWLFSFNLLLVNLLIIQRSRNPLALSTLFLTSLIAFASPYAFSLGVMVGPITSLWILFRRKLDWNWRTLLLALLPAAASVGSLALLMPRILEWTKTEEYIQQGSRGIKFGWPMFEGIVYGQRLLLDRIFFDAIGLGLFPLNASRFLMQRFDLQESTAIWLYAVLFPLPAVGWITLLRHRPAAWRIVPMLAILIVPYMLAMPGRSWVHYLDLAKYWTRYQLYPQLGLALLIADGVRQIFFEPRQSIKLASDASINFQPVRPMSLKAMLVLFAVIGFYLAIHFAGPPYSK